MTNKMILPLLTTTFMFIGSISTLAAENKRDHKETSPTAMSTATPLTPLPLHSDVRSDSSWLVQEHAMAKLLPKNDRDFEALVSHVTGEWDPEGPPDYNGILQKTIYISKLEGKLAKIMAKISKDPLLNGESSLPPLLSSSLQMPMAPEASLMPEYNGGKSIPENMVLYCYDVALRNLLNDLKLSLYDVSPDMLADSLFNHSVTHNKKWPKEMLVRLAHHIINLDDLPEDEQKDANKSDPDKK